MRRRESDEERRFTIALYRKGDFGRDEFLGWALTKVSGFALYNARLAWIDETNREYAAYKEDVRDYLV